MKIILGLAVGVTTWFMVILIQVGIYSSDFVNMLFTFFVGPFLGYQSFKGVVQYFAKLAEQEQAKRTREREKEDRRIALDLCLANLVTYSKKLAHDLPILLRGAEDALDIAEQEFTEGTFAPFWDAIERAANELATFRWNIQQLTKEIAKYKKDSAILDNPAKLSLVELHTIPDVSPIIHRMNKLVRRAQQDFHFATIYEQRKTNILLIEGFTNLGQALDRLQYSMQSSLTELHEEVRQSRLESAEDSEYRRVHEQKQLEMLDNIQRHKRPT